MLALQTLYTLLLVFLNTVHLLPDCVFFGLELRLFFVFLGLTKVLIDALVEVVVLDIKIIFICSQKFTWQELSQNLALEFFNYVFSIDSENFLLGFLLYLLNVCGIGNLFIRSINLDLLLLFFLNVSDETLNFIEGFHLLDHFAQSLGSLDKLIDMSI